MLASIKITDGFLRSGSLAKFVKTVAAREGSKALEGAPTSAPIRNAEVNMPMTFFIVDSLLPEVGKKNICNRQTQHHCKCAICKCLLLEINKTDYQYGQNNKEFNSDLHMIDLGVMAT